MNSTYNTMELTTETETLRLINGFLMVGNEYNENITTVCLEDISKLQNKELVSKLELLQKTVQESLREVKELAIESYHNEPMIEGILDEAGEVSKEVA